MIEEESLEICCLVTRIWEYTIFSNSRTINYLYMVQECSLHWILQIMTGEKWIHFIEESLFFIIYHCYCLIFLSVCHASHVKDLQYAVFLYSKQFYSIKYVWKYPTICVLHAWFEFMSVKQYLPFQCLTQIASYIFHLKAGVYIMMVKVCLQTCYFFVV